MFKTEIGEFKGSKTISILNGDRRIVSFGVSKAKAILACVEEIKKFAESVDGNSIDLSNLSEDEKKVIEQFLKK
jgi:hypothetical protein